MFLTVLAGFKTNRSLAANFLPSVVNKTSVVSHAALQHPQTFLFCPSSRINPCSDKLAFSSACLTSDILKLPMPALLGDVF